MIRRVAQLHDRYFEMTFGGVLTSRQYALLLALAHEELSDQVTLSQIIAVDRSTVGDMVARLCKRGLITREKDPKDQRRSKLRLTVAGHDLITRLAPRIELVNEKLFAPLTKEERKTLVALLTKVATVDDPTFPNYRASILALLESASAHNDK